MKCLWRRLGVEGRNVCGEERIADADPWGRYGTHTCNDLLPPPPKL